MSPGPGAAPPRAGRRRLRLPGLAAAVIVGGAAAGATLAWTAGWRGSVRYADIPLAELPLPPVPAPVVPPVPPAAIPTSPSRSGATDTGPEGAHAAPLPAFELEDEPQPSPPPEPAAAHATAAPHHADGQAPADAAGKASAGGPGARDVAAPGSVAHHTLPAVAIGGPPAEPDPALLERRGAVALPVVAADGRKSRRVYARAAPRGGHGPRVAVLVTGVGLAREASEAVLRRMPPDVSVAVSVHADDADGWLRRARAGGREALLTLPLEPADPARVDPGPGALGVRQDPAAREAGLTALLGRGTGYVGFAANAGAFATAPAAFSPVAAELAGRGLALLELGGSRLAGVARAGGLPYAGTGSALDEAPSAARVDLALGALEAAALRDGSAVGWARGYPVALERVAAWAETLPGKGLTLVPVSALLPEPGAGHGGAAATEAAAAAAAAAVTR